ncbi:MAG: TIGR01440 family protein [Caldiserica bacterium]|jgi:uncharacterized protein (TIGR01440 family)|nr:TIGR01440 family protein [Caldisericota bacterium]MDH7563084.1 TIGR01440 family protein [Caldisericota bacterium]
MTPTIYSQIKSALLEMLERFPPKGERILVIGCSTSEVVGERIGTASNTEIAEEIFRAILEVKEAFHLHLAFQCCEHLNRALVVERAVQERFNLEEVLAIPRPHAGGALAAYAFSRFKDPCLVSSISADYGMDIGDTLIGMHLRRVVVPVRVQVKNVGKANLVLARTRPPYTGGKRAEYPEEKRVK